MFFTKRYGDYYTVIFFQLFLIPILLILFIINSIILYFYEKKKNNTSLLKNTLIILISFISINYIYGKYDSNRNEFLNIWVNDEMRWILYDNNSFRLRVQYPHGTSNYSGSYSLNKNVITIEDSLIEKKSKNNITTSYLLETKNLKLISEKSSFKNLAIQQSTAHNTSLAK